jgi:hypothetical protein
MMATILLMDLLDKKNIGQQMDMIFNGHHPEEMDTKGES